MKIAHLLEILAMQKTWNLLLFSLLYVSIVIKEAINFIHSIGIFFFIRLFKLTSWL